MNIQWENRTKYHPKNLHKCSCCNQIFEHTLENFDIKSKKEYGRTVLESKCKQCAAKKRAQRVKYRKGNIETYSKRLVASKRWVCNKDNIEFDLTTENLINLWKQQNGECYYSGFPMNLQAVTESNKHPHVDFPSLDRKDPTKGYINDNVVWTTYGINRMKNNFTHEQFIEFCKIVAGRFK